MEENNWYLYRHLKPSGEVFYIGIGKTKNFKRAYSKNNRNKWWKNIVSKYEFEVQILTKDLSEQDIKDLERALISWYGRRDLGKGTLVNLTDGGEGLKGFIQNEASKSKRAEKIKTLYIGAGNPFYGKFHTENTKKHIGDVQKEFFTYLEGDINRVSKSTPRKKSRTAINIITNIEFNSLREVAQYYNVSVSTMKSRMIGDKMFKGNIWYKDVHDLMSDSIPPIISFLEQTMVLEHNIKNN